MKEYDIKAIGKRISDLRGKRTQKDIAGPLNVTRQTISKWERGEGEPSFFDMLRLCNVLGCELSYLLGETECTTRDLQGVQDYTGLSEGTISALHDLKDKEIFFYIEPEIESLIINGVSFLSALSNLRTVTTASYASMGNAERGIQLSLKMTNGVNDDPELAQFVKEDFFSSKITDIDAHTLELISALTSYTNEEMFVEGAKQIIRETSKKYIER